jgi:hypothetical protein
MKGAGRMSPAAFLKDQVSGLFFCAFFHSAKTNDWGVLYCSKKKLRAYAHA